VTWIFGGLFLALAMVVGLIPAEVGPSYDVTSCGSPLNHSELSDASLGSCSWALQGRENWMWVLLFAGGLAFAVGLLAGAIRHAWASMEWGEV
jgi:hypothetical protein